MKRIIKLILILSMTLCLMVSLCSCSVLALLSGMGNNDLKDYLKGNIDSVYLNIHSDKYLEMVESDKATCEKEYRDGLAVAGEALAYYFAIYEEELGESYSDLSQELRDTVEGLMDKIYSHTKYEIKSFNKSGDKFNAEVIVSPINILELAYDALVNRTHPSVIHFYDKYENVDFSTISDAEYKAISEEYGYMVVAVIESLMPELGYKEARSLVIRIEDVDGYYTINADDWALFDSYVIYFP